MRKPTANQVSLMALTGVFALSAPAWGQDDAEESTAKEGEGVQASPDVQSQVGVGTEKETPEDENYDPTSPFQEGESQRRKKSFGHSSQFGVRVGVVLPYKVLIRFDDSPPCNPIEGDMTEESKTCGLVSPAQLDVALSFAPTDGLEPFAFARLGLAEETATRTEAALIFGGGLRAYTMNEAKFKLYFEVAAGLEMSGALEAADEETRRYGNQFFGRLGFGPQYDLNRYLGFYASVGPGFAMPRAITLQLEANAGIQARFP